MFWVCAVAGGGFILLQSLLGLMGSDDDSHHDHAAHGDALHLLSLRAIAAGLCFLGLAGLAALEWGFPPLLALRRTDPGGGSAQR